MTRLVAFQEDAARQIAEATRLVLRGAMEHPFYRARWPVAGGTELILMRYLDHDKFLTCFTATGFKITGLAWDCDVVIGGGAVPSDGDELDIDGTYFSGILQPESFFWARPGNKTNGDPVYYVVCGAGQFSTQFLKGTVRSSGTTADITIQNTLSAGTSGGSSIEVAFEPFCTEETFAENQTVGLIFQGDHVEVIKDCCPPDGT